MASNKFDSEGFDLDASASTDGADVIYEVGGGVTADASHNNNNNNNDNDMGPMAKAEQFKEQGNIEFRHSNHLDAYDYYTDAIEATPYGEGVGPTGQELLSLKMEFEEEERERMLERHRRESEERRRRRVDGDDDKDAEKSDDGEETTPVFTPPRHLYSTKLAVYHANRAATLLHLGRNSEAIEDCDIALLLNPTYVKALLRRCTANERVENTEQALKDAKAALLLEPNNTAAKKTVIRLQKVEEERMEKLKEETMGKLKDLGNSILGNFGLSLDNFNAVQDPKTGGYSISFNQGK